MKNEWTTLLDLAPGSLFRTEDGILAVKSEYFQTRVDGLQGMAQCVLLESGEYACFPDGNSTLVQELNWSHEPQYIEQDKCGHLIMETKIEVDSALIPSWADYVIVDRDGGVWAVDRDQGLSNMGHWLPADGEKDQRILLGVVTKVHDDSAISYTPAKISLLPF